MKGQTRVKNIETRVRHVHVEKSMENSIIEKSMENSQNLEIVLIQI